MNIKIKREDKKVTISVSGSIDTNTAPEFIECLKEQMPGSTELLLDLKEAEYISSAGLRAILFAQKTMDSQGSMTVANVNSDIMDTFELTGFTEILKII